MFPNPRFGRYSTHRPKIYALELSPIPGCLLRFSPKQNNFSSAYMNQIISPNTKHGDPKGYHTINFTLMNLNAFEVVTRDQNTSLYRAGMNNRQNGFHLHNSRDDTLDVITNTSSTVLDNSSATRLGSVDISKAFCRVPHEGLQSKLFPFGFDADVPKGSMLSTTLVRSFIIDLLIPTFNPLHRFADAPTIHCIFPYSTVRQVASNSDHDRIVLSASPASDLRLISVWGSTNHVCFNPSKTFLFSASLTNHPYSLQFNSDSTSPQFTDPLPLLGLFISSSL